MATRSVGGRNASPHAHALADATSASTPAIAAVPMPAPITTGAHFALEVAVCPRAGAAVPRALAVDAVMPEHRHGMNYRPEVTARDAGIYRASGLMFHMPGRWDILFDLVTGSGTERLSATKRIE